MLTDFLARIWPSLPLFFLAGLCFLIGGLIWWIAIRRHEVTMGAVPRKLAAPLPPWAPLDMYRADSDTHVIPSIPGATPEERTDEQVAFNACIDVIDEAAHLTEELMHAVAAKLRDDCPLTTQEIEIPESEATPFFHTTHDHTATRELSEVMKKVSAP